MLVLSAFLMMALGYFVTDLFNPDRGFIAICLLAGAQEILMFGVPALLLLKGLGESKESVKSVVRAPDPYTAGLSLLSSVAYVLSAVIITSVTYVMMEGLGIKPVIPEPFTPEALPELLVALVMSALIPAICEETFFRYALPMLFKKKLSRRHSVILSSLIFSALHLSLVAVPMLMVLSLLMHRVFDRHKNLSLLFIFHGMYNFSVLLFNYTKAEPGFSAALLSVAVFVIATKFLLREEA